MSESQFLGQRGRPARTCALARFGYSEHALAPSLLDGSDKLRAGNRHNSFKVR